MVAASSTILMIFIDGNKIEGESASLSKYKALDYASDIREMHTVFQMRITNLGDIAELDICNISEAHVQEAQEVRKAYPEISSDRLKSYNLFASKSYVFCELIFEYYDNLQQLKAVGANTKLDEIAHLKQSIQIIKEITVRMKLD